MPAEKVTKLSHFSVDGVGAFALAACATAENSVLLLRKRRDVSRKIARSGQSLHSLVNR
jgi:predicted flavoprotein YhiN